MAAMEDSAEVGAQVGQVSSVALVEVAAALAVEAERSRTVRSEAATRVSAGRSEGMPGNLMAAAVPASAEQFSTIADPSSFRIQLSMVTSQRAAMGTRPELEARPTMEQTPGLQFFPITALQLCST